MKRLIIGLEDHMAEFAALQDTAIPEVPEAELISSALDAQIYTNDCDVADIFQVTDDAHTDALMLSGIQEVLVKASNSGEGVDEATSEIARIAVESISARMGIKVRAIPSMEAFASVHSRLTATNIAIEGIASVIVAIWTAIVNAIKRLLGMVGIGSEANKARVENNETVTITFKSFTLNPTGQSKPLSSDPEYRSNVHYKGKSDYQACEAVLNSVAHMGTVVDKMAAYVKKLCDTDFELARKGDPAAVYREAVAIIKDSLPAAYTSKKQNMTTLGVFSRNRTFIVSEDTVNTSSHVAIADCGEPRAKVSESLSIGQRHELLKQCESANKVCRRMVEESDHHKEMLKTLLSKVESYLTKETNRDVAAAVRFTVNLSTTIIQSVPNASSTSVSDVLWHLRHEIKN